MNSQRKDKNNTLKSGERQVRTSLEDIEYWHKWRYTEACKYITKEDTVADFCMGIGYGSYIMADFAKTVTGVDDSQEAVDFSEIYWKKDNINHICSNILELDDTKYDVIVSFEAIEHIKDDYIFIAKMKELANKYIVISVPHISVPLSKSHWHWRHYTEDDIVNKFIDENWEVERLETPMFGKGKAVFVAFKRIN